MIWPLANGAGAVPVLETVVVHAHVLPRVVAPPTLSLVAAVRSGAMTWTVSAHWLLVSLDSMTTLSGSTAHDPPERGFTNDPVAGGVAESETLKAPVPEARTTVPPAAVQVRVSLPVPVSEQAIVPVPLVPVVPDTDGGPYAGPPGRSSVRIVWPLANVAVPAPELATWICHVQSLPSTSVPLTLLVLTAVRSAATTLTVSLHALSVSLCSAITLAGSAAQTPPLLGLVKAPPMLGVALTTTESVPAVPIVTEPLAVHVSVSAAEIEQLTVPVVPLPAVSVGVP